MYAICFNLKLNWLQWKHCSGFYLLQFILGIKAIEDMHQS